MYICVVFFLLYIFCVVFLSCIKITSLYVTDYFNICLADIFWSLKRILFSLSWSNTTDSLPCNLPVFTLKLYECNQVEFYAAFIDAFG